MQQHSLIEELENAVRSGSTESRVNTLRRITDLFLHDANRLNEDQIAVFDDVLCHLAAKIETTALVELGTRLAPVDVAPVGVIKRLAHDDDIAVAAPVLTGSKRLTASDLVEVVQTKGQAHLLAISQRATLDSQVTDVLVTRGDGKVVTSLATNAGARFSDSGFKTLVKKAEGNDHLGEIVGQRRDIPDNLLQELLLRATEAVKVKNLGQMPADRRREVEEVIGKVAKSISKKAEHDYSYAESYVDQIAAAGRLNETIIPIFVRQQRLEELIVALARLSSTPVKTVAELLNGHRNDAVLLPCKAAGLSWATVKLILENRLRGNKGADKIIEVAQLDYAKLTIGTAQRTLRFINVHNVAQ
jgi:uncharacterized protein (DUF2336 family)